MYTYFIYIYIYINLFFCVYMYNEKQGFLPKLLKLKTFGRITRFAQM